MNQSTAYLVELVVEGIVYEEEAKAGITAERAKQIVDSAFSAEYGFNSFIGAGDFISGIPVDLPYSLIGAVCKEYWENIDWVEIAQLANLELKEVNNESILWPR